MTERTEEFSMIAIEVVHECLRARRIHPPFHSVHEAFAVLLEEKDELWDEIKKRKSRRDYNQIRHEALQVAAMAVCLIDECTGAP